MATVISCKIDDELLFELMADVQQRSRVEGKEVTMSEVMRRRLKTGTAKKQVSGRLKKTPEVGEG